MKTTNPSALRFTPLKVSQTFIFDCIKKSVVSLFLLLASCTDSFVAEPYTNSADEEVAKNYIEFEGAVDMGEDITYLHVGGTNNKFWEKDLKVSWVFRESITIEVSKELEVESNSGEIFGGNSCSLYSYTGDAYDTHKVTFVPKPIFWTCIEEENCDPGDEVFEFVISVWESS